MTSKRIGSAANTSKIRVVEARDNKVLAGIIRQVLTEFGADRPGFAWQDPELDFMSRAYAPDQRAYLVAETDGTLVGGAGIGEFDSGDDRQVCELQKMYLLPSARATGLGRRLIINLLEVAKSLGYQYCYLETLSSMESARKLYLRTGFKLLSTPLGDSGHNACDEWYLVDLSTLTLEPNENEEIDSF
jgi:putative acetyltransferase